MADADNADNLALLVNTTAQTESWLYNLEQAAAAGISLCVNAKKKELICVELEVTTSGMVSLFNGISTFVGYLMPKLFS